MLSRRKFLEEEKDCADMLGLTIEEYRESLKKIKLGKSEKKESKQRYDNSFLKTLGIKESMLKNKKLN